MPSSTDTTAATAVGAPTPTSTSTFGTGSMGSTTGANSTGSNMPSSTTPTTGATAATGSASPNADNTKNNKRDAHGSTLTPIDQGNSKSETDITASIRRGVVGEKSLSFTAKNVKIITTGTKVTLRGPVKSDSEKATIEKLAKNTAGVTDVDDQLEVKK